MSLERRPNGTSTIDVFERVLDKGIVIDAWVLVSVVGIDLIGIQARVTVASIETYLKYAAPVATTPLAAYASGITTGHLLSQRKDAE
jgi:gas vesicle structural protein